MMTIEVVFTVHWSFFSPRLIFANVIYVAINERKIIFDFSCKEKIKHTKGQDNQLKKKKNNFQYQAVHYILLIGNILER